MSLSVCSVNTNISDCESSRQLEALKCILGARRAFLLLKSIRRSGNAFFVKSEVMGPLLPTPEFKHSSRLQSRDLMTLYRVLMERMLMPHTRLKPNILSRAKVIADESQSTRHLRYRPIGSEESTDMQLYRPPCYFLQ